MNNIIKVKWNTSLQDYKIMQNKLRNSVVLTARKSDKCDTIQMGNSQLPVQHDLITVLLTV